MLKVIGTVVIVLCLIVILKPFSSEYAYLVRLAAVCAVFTGAIIAFDKIIIYVQSISNVSDVSSAYIKTALKITAVCIMCQLAADICRDCGENALASQTELFGRAAVLFISLPVIQTIYEFAIGLIK